MDEMGEMVEMDEMNAPDAPGAPVSLTIPSAAAGQRLDRVLGLVFPGLGLRRLRRVFAENEVTVDGRARQAAFRVRAGAEVRVRLRPGVVRPGTGAVPAGLAVLAQGADYGAVDKPGGLATASIGPGGQESLEDHLGGLFPGREPVLLGRLDTATSGIVAVAFSPEAVRQFRLAEDRGEAEKTYLAVVQGRIEAPFTTARELDTAHRVKTRVRDRDTDDPLRRTAVTPLGHDPGTGLTLVRAVIAKGARHQIRAHLAAMGHPILGDALYGNASEGGGRLFLHHARIIFPGFTAVSNPPWSRPGGGSVLGIGPGVEQALDDVVLANEIGS
ncbi:MAG: RluA family pseudouridine synthase [Desulfovibrionaceae bacterium]|nr:RluA family pseudouridine synthase [Desulfovibrionaceae bacterium]